MAARCRGAVAVEFALILIPSLMVFAFASEWLRFSLMQQALARATHQGARAIAAQPTATGCEAAVTRLFANDATTRWLFDHNNDGTLDVAATTATGWPGSTAEVDIAISWEANPNDATETEIEWDDAAAGDCGGTGSWLRLRTRTSPLPWFGGFRPLMPNGLPITHESWARINRA